MPLDAVGPGLVGEGGEEVDAEGGVCEGDGEASDLAPEEAAGAEDDDGGGVVHGASDTIGVDVGGGGSEKV